MNKFNDLKIYFLFILEIFIKLIVNTHGTERFDWIMKILYISVTLLLNTNWQ